MMKVSRGSKGFTLIELLIVVAIIGILAAIAIPAYTGYTAKAKIAGVVHSLGAIKNAVAAYYTESGGYPTAADANAIKNLFGVDVPVQYATYAILAANAGITATVQNVSSDTNTKTITLTPDWPNKTWSWGTTNGLAATYLPKELAMKGASRPLPLSKRGGGFTLIELLIAMAVVAIVAIVAVPMYTKYVKQARQQDAKVQLIAIRQAEEMYRLQYSTYTNQTALLSGWKAASGRYTSFSITAFTATTFTAQAAGNIDGDATVDTWTIDQDDNLTNTIDDVAG